MSKKKEDAANRLFEQYRENKNLQGTGVSDAGINLYVVKEDFENFPIEFEDFPVKQIEVGSFVAH